MNYHCAICTRSATYADDAEAEGDGWDLGDGGEGWHTCPICTSPKHRRMSRDRVERARENADADARE